MCYGRGKDIRKQKKKWYRIKNCCGRGKICKVVDKKRMAVEEETSVRYWIRKEWQWRRELL